MSYDYTISYRTTIQSHVVRLYHLMSYDYTTSCCTTIPPHVVRHEDLIKKRLHVVRHEASWNCFNSIAWIVFCRTGKKGCDTGIIACCRNPFVVWNKQWRSAWLDVPPVLFLGHLLLCAHALSDERPVALSLADYLINLSPVWQTANVAVVDEVINFELT